jgi:hypothetical protein
LRRGAGLLGTALATACALFASCGFAASHAATVLLAGGSSVNEARVAERFAAELQSAGYQVYKADAATDTACAAQSPIARSLESYGESAWVQISGAEGSAKLAVRLCYRDAIGRLSQSVLELEPTDVERGALAGVEALNGLRAEPTPPPCPPAPIAAPALVALPKLHHALRAGTAIVFDPLGVGPIVGVTAGLESGIAPHVSLDLDGFAPVRSSRLTGVDRTLDVDVAWLRAGPTLSWPLWIANVKASLAAGPAVVWASSHAQPPLIGSARRTTAFVISAGGALELPRDAAWFLRAYYEVGTMLPRIDLVTAPRDTDHLGPLLFQLGATLGVRWTG